MDLLKNSPLSLKIHLRDCTTMRYQDSDFCANCYQNIADLQNVSKKFTDQIESFVNGRWCQRGVTVAQAIVILFDVIRKSHLSPIILNEEIYKLCHNCFSSLSQLYVLHEEFTSCSSPPSYLFSLIKTNRFFDGAPLAEVKSEPCDEDDYPAYNEVDDFDDPDYVFDGSHMDHMDLFPNNYGQAEADEGPDKTLAEVLDCLDKQSDNVFGDTGSRRSTFQKIKRDEGKCEQKLRRRTHVCPECNMGFTRTNHLRRHALLHSAKEFTCECGVGFRAQRNLQYHLKYNCPNNQLLEKKPSRPVIEKSSSQQDQVEKSASMKQAAKLIRIAKKSKHTSSQKPQGRKEVHLVCSLEPCGKVFSSNYKLRRHEAIHLVKPFICEYCHQSYGSEVLLSNHVKTSCKSFNNMDSSQPMKTDTTKAKIDEAEVEIVEVNKEADTVEVLQQIKQKKRSNNTKRYACHCGASFSRTNHLHDHSLVHREANVLCEYCNSGFINQEKLDKHKKVVHDPDYQKPNKSEVNQILSSGGNVVDVKIKKKGKESNAKEDCKVCGKSIRARNMRIHLVSHSETRPAVCELCGLAFKLYWSLKCHQKYAHGDNRPFLCRFCGAAFKRNQHLLDHEVVKHSDTRLYVCDEPGCTKTFKSSRNLRQHRHLHQGVKFPCPECGKIFSRKDNLKVHRDKSCRPPATEGVIISVSHEFRNPGYTFPSSTSTTTANNPEISVAIDAHQKGVVERRQKSKNGSKSAHRLQAHKTHKASSSQQSISFNSAISSGHFLYAQTPTNILINDTNPSQSQYPQTSSSFLVPLPTHPPTTVFSNTATTSSTGLTNPIMFDLDNFGKM